MLPVDQTVRHGPGLRLPFGSMRCASRGLKGRAQRKDLPSFVSKINLEKFSASIWGSVDFIHDARLLSPLNPESGKADSSRSRSCAAAVGPGRHSASPPGPPGRVPTAPRCLIPGLAMSFDHQCAQGSGRARRWSQNESDQAQAVRGPFR